MTVPSVNLNWHILNTGTFPAVLQSLSLKYSECFRLGGEMGEGAAQIDAEWKKKKKRRKGWI